MKKYFVSTISILIILVSLVFTGCSSEEKPGNLSLSVSPSPVGAEFSRGTLFSGNKKPLLEVEFINVGQGDSILIRTPGGKVILIDAGPDESSSDLISEINEKNIRKIDVLIATHPHKDHIGGMDEIINNYEIGRFYMPDKTIDTTTYKKLIKLLAKKKISRLMPDHPVTDISPDPLINLDVLSPGKSSDYEDINDCSMVLKLIYNKSSFLLTGDTTTKIESELLKKNIDLDSDVLKIAHHGSRSSTSADFLDQVTPDSAVISLEKDINYKHPDKSILDKLNLRKIKIYRTDENGDITYRSDGTEIDSMAEKIAS